MLDPIDISDEAAWKVVRQQWQLRSDTVYLNHGSFGPAPQSVTRVQQHWQQRLREQPMDFFVRHHENAWYMAREALATFVDSEPSELALVGNATHAMNCVAASVTLESHDQVVLNDHEYGAVRRIWERACAEAGAAPPVIAQLPRLLETPAQVVEAIFQHVNDRTRLIVVSHITSPTALVLPVQQIVAEARKRDVMVCVDGPHAIAQIPLSLRELGADFYTASLHKWLSAPFGSGFLYVDPRHHTQMRTPLLSWGRLPENRQHEENWSDEFLWAGTSDPSAVLSVPAAIRFLGDVIGIEQFRRRSRYLVGYAAEKLGQFSARPPFATLPAEEPASPPATDDHHQWYASMAYVPLPNGDHRALQRALWERFGIEIPVVAFGDERAIRVSCHLYNGKDQIDYLANALQTLL